MQLKQQEKQQNKVVKKGIEFIGKVIEVHSGDSLTIQSNNSGRTGRFNFTNVRAPQIKKNSMKPYAYEAKEFLRRSVIGKDVKVKIEYEKTINVQKMNWDDQEDLKEKSETKVLVFCILWVDEKNIAQQLLENGLAELQKPFSEDEQSQVYEELQQAVEVAKQKKLGLFNTKEYSYPKFNDLTQKTNNIQLVQWNFEHLRDAGKCHAVVELVLNGSRFKVRVTDQNCFIMMVLEGVRCLPNDENFAGFDEWSNKALKFSKSNLLQRDVQIQISSVDKKGVFRGQLLFKKEDYATTLLQQGFAICFGDSKLSQQYLQLEQETREKKVGLWSANLKLDSITGEDYNQQQKVVLINKTFQATISEVIDFNEFYLQEKDNQQLYQLEDELAQYDPNKWSALAKPVKNGTPCIALFSSNDQYYRAVIVRQSNNKNEKYIVQFVDYGNYDEVELQDIRKMPEKYAKIPYCVQKCQFAFSEQLNKKSKFFNQITDFLMEKIFEQNVIVNTVYKEGDINFVVLYNEKDKEIEKSVNAILIQKGFLRLNLQIEIPQDFIILQEFNSNAKQQKLGIWQEQTNDDDDN